MSRLVVGAVALSLALAGCGGDPKAEPSPTPSPSATSPVATTPTAPVMPEAAKANTKAGAVAFVRYYVEAFNFAQSTGQVGALAPLEQPGCDACARVRRELQRIYGAEGHIDGGDWIFGSAIAEPTADEQWLVAMSGRFQPSDVYAKPGDEPEHSKGGRVLTNFRLLFEAGWRVVRWWDAQS